MKKAIFTLIILAVATMMSAQSLQFEYEGNVYQNGQTIISPYDEDMGEYLQEMKIRNLTNDELNVIVEREIVDNIPDALIYFCWGQCLAPFVDVSDPLPVPANSLSDADLSFHVMFTGDESGVVKVNYYAYDRGNPDDKISITVLAGATAETDEHTVSLSQAYPNPATTQVHFDYSFDGDSNVNVLVYNLLGQEVRNQNLNGNHGRINIAVDDLQPGIYFCSIQVNNVTVKTEKFIVKR